jgi:hypothetical protein
MNSIVPNFFMFGDKYPPMKFDDRSKNNKFSRLHKFNGIGDLNLFELMYRLYKRLRFEMQFGMDPEIWLYERDSSPKFFN